MFDKGGLNLIYAVIVLPYGKWFSGPLDKRPDVADSTCAQVSL